MSVNLTPLLFLVGLGIFAAFAEKFLSKAGNETVSFLVGLVTFVIGSFIVIRMLNKLFDELAMFLRF